MSSSSSSTVVASAAITPLIRRTAGSLFLTKANTFATIAASGLLLRPNDAKKNKKPKQEQNEAVEQKAASAQPEPVPARPPPQQKALDVAKKWMAYAGAGVYVAYPVSLLMLFRISEQISWLRLFEHYHGCHNFGIGSADRRKHCLQLYGIHFVQLSTATVLTALYWKQNSKISRQHLTTGLLFFLALGIGAFIYNVDELSLYQLPQDLTLEGKTAVITGKLSLLLPPLLVAVYSFSGSGSSQ